MATVAVRRFQAAVAAVVLGAGVAAVPGTAVQAGGKYGPQLVAKLAGPPVKAGKATWVKTWWTTRSDVCDVRVTVRGDDVAALLSLGDALRRDPGGLCDPGDVLGDLSGRRYSTTDAASTKPAPSAHPALK